MKTPLVIALVIVLLAHGPLYGAEAPKPSASEIQKQIEEIKAAKQREVVRYQRAQYLIDLEKAKDDAVLNIRALEEKEQELTKLLNSQPAGQAKEKEKQ